MRVESSYSHPSILLSCSRDVQTETVMDNSGSCGRKNVMEKERVRKVRGEYEALRQMFSNWTTCPLSSKVDVLKVTYSVFCEVLGVQNIELPEHATSHDTTGSSADSEQVNDQPVPDQAHSSTLQGITPDFSPQQQTPEESSPLVSGMDKQDQPSVNQGQISGHPYSNDPDIMPQNSMVTATSLNSAGPWRSVNDEVDNIEEEDDDDDDDDDDHSVVEDTNGVYLTQPRQFQHSQLPLYNHCHPQFPPYTQLGHMFPAVDGHHDPLPPFILPSYSNAHAQWASNYSFVHPSEPPHITHPYRSLPFPNNVPHHPRLNLEAPDHSFLSEPHDHPCNSEPSSHLIKEPPHYLHSNEPSAHLVKEFPHINEPSSHYHLIKDPPHHLYSSEPSSSNHFNEPPHHISEDPTSPHLGEQHPYHPHLSALQPRLDEEPGHCHLSEEPNYLSEDPSHLSAKHGHLHLSEEPPPHSLLTEDPPHSFHSLYFPPNNEPLQPDTISSLPHYHRRAPFHPHNYLDQNYGQI